MKKTSLKIPDKTKKILAGCAALLLVIVVVIVSIHAATKSEEATHRENQVTLGTLTVGITESGTVDIGTVEQTFDLDMSALTRVTTSNSNSSSSAGAGASGMGNGGGMGGGSDSAFGQMFDMGGTTSGSQTDSDSDLVVESIQVAVGQEIQAGDVILTLESEGVDELKEELEENTSKASADLEALIADQKLSTITAEYTLNTALEYGDYAETEKESTIASLKQAVTEAQSSYDAAKLSLDHYTEQLETAKADYEDAVVYMNNAIWSRDHGYNKDTELYLYIGAFNEAESAISNVESLENTVEQLEERVESTQSTVDRCASNLSRAKRAYDSGVISAEENYEIRMLSYDTAQETYDVTIALMEQKLKEQQETYDEAESKWEEFNSYIDGQNILSDYSGVITDISVAAGDGIDTGTSVITLYNADDVTMTVTVDEEDMTDIQEGGAAEVLLTAYPEEPFEATITEISDATTDSSGNTTRDVTVTIQGDMSKLYQGMTGEVTFITKQVENVLYVSNRAIIRENGLSYVKVEDEDGSVKTVEVVTGFSDGTNVEIVSGLSEGQTVVIEKGDTK